MVSREPYHLDPEVDGLLREIAADPRSSLFRAPRPAPAVAWAGLSDCASERSPDFTAAERHLLAVHRAEVAWLLKKRWSIEITSAPQRVTAIAYQTTVPRVSNHRTPVAWDHDAEATLAQAPRQDEESKLLQSLVGRRSFDDVTLSRLVATAMYIEPSNHGRIYLAQDLIRADQVRAARALLEKVIRTEVRGRYESYALDNIAVIEGNRLNFHLARDLYARAASIGDVRTTPLGCWFLLSLQTADMEQALEAGARIDALPAASDSLVDSFVVAQRQTRQGGFWSPTEFCVPTLRRLGDCLGPRARRVAHAVL